MFKWIARRVTEYRHIYDGRHMLCPRCKRYLPKIREQYCGWCGQKLKWDSEIKTY